MILTELFVILALIVANGVFAGAEIAIVSLRRTRVQQLVDAARVGAQTRRGAARGAGALLRDRSGRHHRRDDDGGGVRRRAHRAATSSRCCGRCPSSAASNADDVALVIVVVLISFLSLVLGELVPKSLALRRSERYALLVSPSRSRRCHGSRARSSGC